MLRNYGFRKILLDVQEYLFEASLLKDCLGLESGIPAEGRWVVSFLGVPGVAWQSLPSTFQRKNSIWL